MKFSQNDQDAIRFINELKIKEFGAQHLAQFIQMYEINRKSISYPYSHPLFYQYVSQELMRRLRTFRDEKLIETIRAVSQFPRAIELLDSLTMERAMMSEDSAQQFPQMTRLLNQIMEDSRDAGRTEQFDIKKMPWNQPHAHQANALQPPAETLRLEFKQAPGMDLSSPKATKVPVRVRVKNRSKNIPKHD